MKNKLVTTLILMITLLSTLLPTKNLQAALPDTDSISLISSDENGIVLQLTVPRDEFSVEKVFIEGKQWSKLAMEGWTPISDPGAPSLPVLSVALGVQFEVSVDVNVSPGSNRKLQLEAPIMPAPDQEIIWPIKDAAMVTSQFPTLEQHTVEDSTIYQNNAIFPGVFVEISGDGIQRQQRVLSLNLYPIQYDPSAQNLVIYEELLIEIKFNGKGVSQKDSFLEDSQVFENILRGSLLNYESAKAWRISSDDINRYLAADSMIESIPFQPPNPARRIRVNDEGFYYLGYADLSDADLPVDSWEAETVQIFYMGEEIAIQFDDSDQDGVFDPEDGFIFYAQALESKYSQENIYWLTYGDVPQGLRMTTIDGAYGGAEMPDSFEKTVHLEENQWYLSGAPGSDELERYLWASIFAASPGNPKSWTTTINLSEPTDGSGVLTANLFGYTSNTIFPDHHVNVYVNDVELPDAEVYWDGYDWQITQGTIPPGVLIPGDNEITIELPHDTGAAYEIVYIDWISLTFPSAFQAVDDSINFDYDEGTWFFQADGFSSSDLNAYDISDPGLVKIIENATILGAGASYSLQFQDQIPSGETKTYQALANSAYKTPLSIESIGYEPVDLASYDGGADYILISHADFMTEADDLVTHRAGQGWRTLLVDVQQIYDAFGYGVEGAAPIKQFLGYTYQNWLAPAPSIVVLLGDGHYDPKDYEGYGRESFIPPYLAYADPGLGETAADNRYVTLNGEDPLAEMMLGRLAVNSFAEANAIIEKIIAYDNLLVTNPGDWQRQVLGLASAADNVGNFPALSDAIFEDTIPQPFAVEKIYYKTTHDTIADATVELKDAINSGKLFVNFVGHGFTNGWAAQNNPLNIYLTTGSLGNFENLNLYPIILAMTCWEGYYIHPREPNDPNAPASLGEMITRLSNAGAVASWSPTGLGLTVGHNRLSRGFYQAVFENGAMFLGEATEAGKLNLWSGGASLDMLDTYVLFGDPATKIAFDFTAVYDEYSVDEDQSLAVLHENGVLSNDLHPQNSILTAELVTDVAHGTLDLEPDGSFIYTPTPDFFGTDSFTYTANDGTKDSNLALVKILVNNVNDPPVPVNRFVVVDINKATEITLTATDPDGDELVFFVADEPNHGQLSGTAPNLVYTPDTDYVGLDQFTFNVYEGGSISAVPILTERAAAGIIDIKIEPINDPPKVFDIPDQTINRGNAFAVIHLDDYVLDEDNDDAEISWTYSGNSELLVNIIDRVASITAPGPEWLGKETITFRAADPDGLWDEDMATFTVKPVIFLPLILR